MAASGLLVVLLSSIFLLTVTAAVVDGDYQVDCDDSKSSGCDTYSALALIGDLKEKVPGDPRQAYCNVVTSEWSGRQIFGYAYCTTVGRSDDPPAACFDCLSGAGDALIGGCRYRTGSAGECHDVTTRKVGTNTAVCVDGGNDAASACHGCLSIAGNILMCGCQGTGSGQVIGEHDLCYVRVGFGGCPARSLS
ncbi:unnamed protein product [Linum tenue]|uniref:Gnk2-homologous domain-containing protein n=1 Tax=Linum tenue TaxID=586396 RepID=A0AAV0N1R7_9ROSI|nr:unnamed protein product [Linum tenue]